MSYTVSVYLTLPTVRDGGYSECDRRDVRGEGVRSVRGEGGGV